MSDTDIKIKFNCNGSSTSAYSCSKAGDNSGVYVQSTDYDALAEQNKVLIEALEHIKKHQEVMAGEDKMILSKLAVYNIAVKALDATA